MFLSFGGCKQSNLNFVFCLFYWVFLKTVFPPSFWSFRGSTNQKMNVCHIMIIIKLKWLWGIRISICITFRRHATQKWKETVAREKGGIILIVWQKYLKLLWRRSRNKEKPSNQINDDSKHMEENERWRIVYIYQWN